MRIGRQPQVTPITDMQEMLRLIYPDTTLSKDGQFGSETKRVVERFQKEYSLPITGIADLNTWEAIVKAYEQADITQGQAEPLLIILQPNQVIRKNSDNVHLYLIQGVLTAISRYYDQMPVVQFTGILDESTADAIAWFQALSALPITGEIDKNTWRHLAKHYRSIVGDGTGTYPARIAQQPNESDDMERNNLP